jgi:uncharacterized protein
LKVGRLQGMKVLTVRPPGRPKLAAWVADRPRERLLGLAGLRGLPLGTGLLIPRCRSVHTLGMRFGLDVLFVTLEGETVVVHDERRAVPPGRIVVASRAARAIPGLAALEIPAALIHAGGAFARVPR